MTQILSRYSSLIVGLIFLAACSDMGDPLILVPEIELSAMSLNFGEVTVGNVQTRQVNLINRGLGDLEGEATLNQSGDNFALNSVGPFSLSAGDSLTLTLEFAPATVSAYSAQVMITSNAPEQESLIIELQGSGTTLPVPTLSLSSINLNFGTVAPNTSHQRQITLLSTGTDTLRIDSMTVDLVEFSIPATTNFVLAPGESQVITVEFNASAGTYSGILQIFSNTGDSPHSVQLSALVEIPVSYAASVQPVFNASCSGCHGSNGGLDLTSYANLMAGNSNNGPVVSPGNGSASLLIRKLRGTAGQQMPAGGPFLSESVISTIETWIDQGALNN